ncbi:hypothetical protein GCM10011613_03110 [Cellvibrio zantedeschiae]|uniref:Peptide O-xylosyltransferase n=1 Tax=Cellvibrio zantedeschiae TaxID=1237077 RepID=A0ABQ3ANI8_9GAMM|nr:hypothetical protein GCM10011613_03110 [Cellvibrio zantedeschiae]
MSDKKIIYLLLLSKIFIKKKLLKKVDFFGGSQWWALRTISLKKIISFVEKNPNFSNFFKDALIPDELFFQTALVNICENNTTAIKPKIVYLSWDKANDLSPKTFLIKDIAEISSASTEKLFARKFDQTLDQQVMDEIDRNLKKLLSE